jgi:C-terminal processing protease CtpA/Prc
MSRLFYFFITIFFFSVTNVFSQDVFSQPLPQYQDSEQRLLSFCKLYSTVKYYYPDPNLQDFPWEAFAYKGYEIATTSKNDKEFIKKINKLFHTIAPGVQISKDGFNLADITPKDTSLYPERAFWQHQGGLNLERKRFLKESTLNYIYKKINNKYSTFIYLPPDFKKYSKKTRLSVWLKTENVTDSAEFNFSAFPILFSKAEARHFEIKALNNKWEQYFIEFDPDSMLVSQFHFSITYPQAGTIYVDDLKLEVYSDTVWETIFVPNGDFEQYDATGRLRFWEEPYVNGLAVADSINAIEGKYCLKLPSVQEQILYLPQPLDKPYTVAMPIKYFAYIPLQLYANNEVVFPITDISTIKQFVKKRKDALPLNHQAIGWCMQIWAALYQDYPYRDENFEGRIDSLLINSVNKLQKEKTEEVIIKVPFEDFLLWINDPHARIWFEKTPKQIDRRTMIKVPISEIELTETQCVVKGVLDSVMLQRGDIILQIDGVNIDSLLQIYRNHQISRNLQGASVWKMLSSFGKPEITMTVKRGTENIPILFTTQTNKESRTYKNIRIRRSGKTEDDVLFDSLAKKGLFYMNCETYRSEALSMPLFLPEQQEACEEALDSLVMEINRYDALILDVREERGQQTMPLLHALNERYGIDISKNRYVTKTVFTPVAQFQKDTTNQSLEEKRDVAVSVPIYVLVGLHTHSAPELALLNLKESCRATFIGSNTSGAAGYTCSIQIADDIFLYYTTGLIVGLDNNPMSYQGTGIAPDIYVYPTPHGIAEGRDEVLEKAIEIAVKNIQ